MKKLVVLIFIYCFALSYSKDDAQPIFSPKKFIKEVKENNPQAQLGEILPHLEKLFNSSTTSANHEHDSHQNELHLKAVMSLLAKTAGKSDLGAAAADPLAGLMYLLKGPFKLVYSLFSPIFLPAPYKNIPNVLGGQCKEQMQLMQDQAESTTPDVWWGQMVDSWAKPYSGVMSRVQLKAYGQMDECLTIRHPTQLNFTGKYCIVSVGKGQYPLLRYGTCIPSGCESWVLQENAQSRWSNVVPNKTVLVDCYTEQSPTSWGTWEIAGSVVIGILIVMVAFATALELLKMEKVPIWVQAFSAATNTSKILAVRSGNPKEISCFHALRVFSISWVLLGHQFLFVSGVISNSGDLDEITKNYGSQIVWSGFRAVDTFFLMGGILLAKGLLSMDFCVPKRKHKLTDDKEAEKNEDGDVESNEKYSFRSEERLIWDEAKEQGLVTIFFNFVSKYAFFIFTRVIRIWPGLLLTIMFFAGPSILFVQGPMQSAYTSYVTECRKNWWFDLTFLTNFLATGWITVPGHSATSCLGQAWYVAMDFQLYLMMPFLLLPIKIMKYKQTYIWVLIIISCIIPGVLTGLKDLAPGNVFYGFLDGSAVDYGKYIYYVPWSRSTPYFVGALIGYWLTLYEKSKKNGQELYADFLAKFPTLAKLYPMVWGWAIITAIALAVVFGLVDSNYLSSPVSVHPGTTASIINNGVNILAWCIVVGWVILVCHLGLAGPLNFLLSHPMWQPLSRLSFGVYLVSLPLQILLLNSFQHMIFLTCSRGADWW